MSNYIYCDSCGAGVEPTAEEFIRSEFMCICGHTIEFGEDEFKDALVDMLERIEKLEKLL